MFKTKYRFIEETRSDATVYYTECGTSIFGWCHWEVVLESISCDRVVACARYVKIRNNIPLVHKKEIHSCNQ